MLTSSRSADWIERMACNEDHITSHGQWRLGIDFHPIFPSLIHPHSLFPDLHVPLAPDFRLAPFFCPLLRLEHSERIDRRVGIMKPNGPFRSGQRRGGSVQ